MGQLTGNSLKTVRNMLPHWFMSQNKVCVNFLPEGYIPKTIDTPIVHILTLYKLQLHNFFASLFTHI